MDVQRCVTLHNEILFHGWIHSDHSADTFESQCQTWYDHDPVEAENVRGDLTLDLFNFLRQARQPVDSLFSFFYYVSSLIEGNGLFMDFPTWEHDIEEGDEKRYVTLYMANQLGSHPLGLIFDQETNLGILLPTIWDAEDHFNDKTLWRPLESILESWLNMIRKGMIIAMPEQHYATQAESPPTQYPWIEVSYSKIILQETVDMFNRLVQAIEDRLPNKSATTDEEPIVGLVDEMLLETMRLPLGFVHSFFLGTRRPRFQFIAPGLSIPTSSNFAAQPFWSHLDNPDVDIKHPPILLFASPHLYTAPSHRPTPTPSPSTSPLPWPLSSLHAYAKSMLSEFQAGYAQGANATSLPELWRVLTTQAWRAPSADKPCDLECPFGPPFCRTDSYAAGLYFNPSSNTEDEIRLLLPPHVEGGGLARSSDGGEIRFQRDLYQTGFTPFKGWAGRALLDVLTHWLGMVEREDWAVGEEGVGGGIEVWGEADGAEHWGRYVVPMVGY